MSKISLSLLIIFLTSLRNSSLASDEVFSPIFITDSDEEILGQFPVKRVQLARIVSKIAEQKPKCILVKFFLDLPKDREGDLELANAFSRTKVILQCRIDNTEKRPNDFPAKFLPVNYHTSFNNLIQGKSGWIPLTMFSKEANDLGFADIQNTSYVPLFEQYQGKVVKSLYLCALEESVEKGTFKISEKALKGERSTLQIVSGSNVKISYPKEDNLRFFSATDLLTDKISQKNLKNKIVILGYDGRKIHSLDTPIGKIKAHRIFCYGLFSLHQQLTQVHNADFIRTK